MAGSNIISTIDVRLAANLTGDAKQEFDDLNKSLLAGGLTTKQFTDTLLKMKAILDADTQSTSNLAAATEQLAEGMTSAGTAAKTAADSTGTLKDGINGVNEAITGGKSGGSSGGGLLGSMGKQKIVFTDLARSIDGQGLSLRNLTSTLGLLGPQGLVAGAAIAGIGYALYSLLDTSKEVAAAVKTVNDEFDRFQNRDKYITDSVAEETALLKSRAEAVGATTDQITAIEAAGAQKQLTTAQETLTDLNRQQKQAVQAYLKDDSDGNKAKIDQLNVSIAKEQDIVKKAQDNLEEIGNRGLADDLKKSKELQTRQQAALQNEQDFIARIAEINQDAEQKESTQLTIEYNRRKTDLEKFHLDTKALTTAYLEGLADIRIKFELQQQQEITKLLADEAKKQQEAQTNDLQELLGIQQSFAAITQKDTESKEQNELDNLTAKYNRGKELTMLYGGDVVALTQQYNSAVSAIVGRYATLEVDQENRKQAQILQRGERAGNSILGQKISQYANQRKALDTFQDQLDQFYVEGTISDQDYTDLTNQNAQARSDIRLKEIANYAGYADQVGQALTKIGSALGEQTQAGKDVAIAGTIISTLAGAVKAYESQAEIPVIGPALGIAAAAAALAAGYANVKKIEQTNVPGQAGGSSVSAGLASNAAGGSVSLGAPQIPSATNSTNLSAASVAQIQQTNSQAQPVRAFVVEQDITGTQNRVAGYQGSNTLGGSASNRRQH